MPPRVLETCLYAPDLDAAEAFYVEVIGLSTLLRDPGRHVFLRAEGSMVLVFDPGATRLPPHPGAIEVPLHGTDGAGHVCFAVGSEGLAAWEARFAAHGVAVERRIDWPNGARSVYVRDPAGNSVEVAEPALWGL